MGPGVWHAVYTSADCVMVGKRLYIPRLFLRSFCAFVCTAFTGAVVSNASHLVCLSMLQSHATYWQPCYVQEGLDLWEKEDLGRLHVPPSVHPAHLLQCIAPHPEPGTRLA